MAKVNHVRNPLEQDGTTLLSTRFVITQFLLRLLTVAFTITAIALMASSTAKISMVALGLNFTARYSYSSAYRFLLGADIVVCALVVVSLVVGYVLYRKQVNLNWLFHLFLVDLALMVLMISACGAATAIGYVAINGQPQTLWFSVCDRAGTFCLKNGISIAFSYLSFLCLFILTVMTTYKMFIS